MEKNDLRKLVAESYLKKTDEPYSFKKDIIGVCLDEAIENIFNTTINDVPLYQTQTEQQLLSTLLEEWTSLVEIWLTPDFVGTGIVYRDVAVPNTPEKQEETRCELHRLVSLLRG